MEQAEFYASQHKGKFTLTAKETTYPPIDLKIFAKEKTHIRISAKCVECSLSITYSDLGYKISEPCPINRMNNMYVSDHPLPIPRCGIKFEMKANSENANCEIEFELHD